MDEQSQRTILEKEVNLLCDKLHEAGMGVLDTSPSQDGTLSHLSLLDLNRMKNELANLCRTLGGVK